MLQKNFLGKLSEYVSGCIFRDKEEGDKTAEDFGFFDLMRFAENEEEKEKAMGLFAEWLVFDRFSSSFGNMTGLQYFVHNNPLNLPEDRLKGYRELLNFEVGLFEVVRVDSGQGVLLKSLLTDEEKFIYDINLSLSIPQGVTVWGRIAPVDGRYYGVSYTFFVLPVKFGPGFREQLTKDKEKTMDAKDAANFFQGRDDEGDFEGAESDLDLEEVREHLRQVMAKVGMDKSFSVEQLENWIKNERKYGIKFVNKVMVGLQPENATGKNMDELVQAVMDFANNIPRSRLKGKTPAQAKKEGSKSLHSVDITSVKKYMDLAEKGGLYLAEGDFENAYLQYKNAVKMLADDKMPFIGAFRFYANAAICCFHKGDGDLGEELFNAALRLNPRYDFGIQQREKYLEFFDPLNQPGYEKLTAKQQKNIRKAQEAYRAKGLRRYQRTPFVRYEKFLNEVGISLNFQTDTRSNVYSFGKDGKARGFGEIGRNDPCFCGSGKKFKKCHGK
ncbi:MAG: SEC-C metal-binding domain-containing protein [Patescibacteria group bacterium]